MIVEQSGFGWDKKKKLPTAPKAVWIAYIEVFSLGLLFIYSETS